MSKLVDDAAAKVHKRLLGGELRRLSSDDRSAWARFIMAQWLRSPHAMKNFREESAEVIRARVEADPEEYLAARKDAPEDTLHEWWEAHQPGYQEVIAMTRFLPMAINHRDIGQVIINMFWEVIDLRKANVDLLISDDPVIRFGGLSAPDCAITIPLDRQTHFVAAHKDRRLREHSATKVAKAANTSTVRVARAFVYGTGPHHKRLVERHFGRAVVD
jgi:hypothetical protein